MKKVTDLIKNYPVAFTYAIQALIAAGFGILSAFDIWTPTGEQLGALMAFYIAFMGLVATLLTGKVTPVTNSDGALKSLDRT